MVAQQALTQTSRWVNSLDGSGPALPCADERGGGQQPSAETAAEAMQLRRKLLLSERRKAAAQRTAALLAERGLTLPPDLPRTPRSAQRHQQRQQQQEQHQQQEEGQQPAAAASFDQRRKRRRGGTSAAATTAEGMASMPELTEEVLKLRRAVPEREGSPAAKRRRAEIDLEAAEPLTGDVADMYVASPATTEVQTAGTASTDIAAAMGPGAGNDTVTSPDRRVAAPRASRGEACRSVAVADASASARPNAAAVLPVAGGANGSLALAASRLPVQPPSSPSLAAAAQPAAVTRSAEKLLTALLAAEAAPVTPNVKARAGPMLAVSRPLTGFGDLVAKVRE